MRWLERGIKILIIVCLDPSRHHLTHSLCVDRANLTLLDEESLLVVERPPVLGRYNFGILSVFLFGCVCLVADVTITPLRALPPYDIR